MGRLQDVTTAAELGLTIDAAPTIDMAAFCTDEFPRLTAMLTLYCGDRYLAEDLAQETLVRVVQNWKKVRSADDPHAWCRKVALNLANSWFRRLAVRRRATQRLKERGDTSLHDPDSASAIAVRNAVWNLPVRQKTAIILRFYEDLPVERVAQLMGCRPGTVWALTSQAIGSLRAAGLTDLEDPTDE